MQPLVGIIMGSKSDWETMAHAAETLEALGVPFEVKVVSAHRTPDLLFEYAGSAEERGLELIIAGAGGAAHLPGMCASKTTLPVLGVPVQSKTLNGLDSLLSIVQMPAGIPVATLAIGRAGAVNAALLGASILGAKHPQFREAVRKHRAEQTRNVLDNPDPRTTLTPPTPSPKNGRGGDGRMIGVIGGGQLGRMLALAGYPLGERFRFLDPSPNAPASELAELIVGGYADPAAVERLCDGVNLVTYEFENVPVEVARRIAVNIPVYPPPGALEVAQDRVAEKTFFEPLGIGTAPFREIDDRAALDRAVDELGLPSVLKTRREGYDGKGQTVLRNAAEIDAAWGRLNGAPLILEAFVPFQRELSILTVRGIDGETAFYPLIENHHADGILRISFGPAPNVSPKLQREAEEFARCVLDALNYVGILAIELFEIDGHVIANEMAPRVHNSGHWTIEGAETSQFENDIRAILGLPLGATNAVGVNAMVNLIGTIPNINDVLTIPGAHVHLYGKEPRPNRKLGHVTLRAANRHELAERVDRMRKVI